jgi:signal transduction histidine kinase
MNASRIFYKAIPAIGIGVFLASACIAYTIKYTGAHVLLPLFFDSGEESNRILFHINFYIPFGICCLSLYGNLFFSGFYLRGFCLLAGFASAVIAGYILNDLFTINLCLYSAFIMVSAMAFSPPKNYILSGLSIAAFLLLLFHPRFLGAPQERMFFFSPGNSQIIILAVYLICLGALIASLRFLTEKYLSSEATVFHLNMVGTKMLLFNHRLQEYVKNMGEEVIRKDRLRFTSDLHDSCGYVFTNIIAITDAAISCGFMETEKIHETFHLIQNQAREGLKRTRETLHMIRELQDPVPGSIDAIFQMKTIFEEVTGISVDIESGNMKHDYGPTVNKVLTRIIQEAFTNSVRHGQASHILIQFWEFPSSLSMTVSDNGIGVRHIVKGIGLAGMEERVAAVGGTLEAYSPEDGGFRLKVTIPLVSANLKNSIERKTKFSAGAQVPVEDAGPSPGLQEIL